MAAEPNTVGADAGNGDDTKKSPDTENQASEETKKTDTETKQEEEITFSEAQQKKLDQILNDRLGATKKKTTEQIEAERLEKQKLQEEVSLYRKEKEEQEAKRQEAELEKAREKGNFEKLLELEKQRYEKTLKDRDAEFAAAKARQEQLETKLAEVTIDQTLLTILANRSVDPQAAATLIKSKHKISVDPKTFEITVDGESGANLEEVATTFLKNNAYLDKNPYADKKGAGSNPGGGKPSTGMTFTREQLKDSKFFAEHEAEIMEAHAAGRIK